jgi:hypothetical protein
MNKPHDGRPSLVEFLGSIKFSREQPAATEAGETQQQFARLQPLTRRKRRSEDAQLVRSAN